MIFLAVASPLAAFSATSPRSLSPEPVGNSLRLDPLPPLSFRTSTTFLSACATKLPNSFCAFGDNLDLLPWFGWALSVWLLFGFVSFGFSSGFVCSCGFGVGFGCVGLSGLFKTGLTGFVGATGFAGGLVGFGVAIGFAIRLTNRYKLFC